MMATLSARSLLFPEHFGKLQTNDTISSAAISMAKCSGSRLEIPNWARRLAMQSCWRRKKVYFLQTTDSALTQCIRRLALGNPSEIWTTIISSTSQIDEEPIGAYYFKVRSREGQTLGSPCREMLKLLK
jgi:hypothetical protein